MSENARIGESARYFVANQPMRYGIEIVYSLEVEHCTGANAALALGQIALCNVALR